MLLYVILYLLLGLEKIGISGLSWWLSDQLIQRFIVSGNGLTDI